MLYEVCLQVILQPLLSLSAINNEDFSPFSSRYCTNYCFADLNNVYNPLHLFWLCCLFIQDREIMAGCLWGSIGPLLHSLQQSGEGVSAQPRWRNAHLCTALELSAAPSEAPAVLCGWLEQPYTANRRTVTSAIMDSQPTWGSRPWPGLLFKDRAGPWNVEFIIL